MGIFLLLPKPPSLLQMKHFCWIALAFTLVACTSRSEQAAEYNDQIIEMQSQIIERFNAMDSAKASYQDVEKMELVFVELQAQVLKNLRTLKETQAFKGDKRFLSASINMFDTYKSITDNEYAEMVELLSLPDSVYTKAHQLRVSALQDSVSKAFDLAHDTFTAQQLDFGKKYNVEFEAFAAD